MMSRRPNTNRVWGLSSFRAQSQRHVPQHDAAKPAEVLLTLLVVLGWPLDVPRSLSRGEFDVIAPLGQRIGMGEVGPRRDVSDHVGVRVQHVPGDGQGTRDVPQATGVLRVKQERANLRRAVRGHGWAPLRSYTVALGRRWWRCSEHRRRVRRQGPFHIGASGYREGMQGDRVVLTGSTPTILVPRVTR